MTDRLYFRQLLSGSDFAASDIFAQQMRNFAYLIGDRETGDAMVVDPAYSAGELVDALEADGMHLSGVLLLSYGLPLLGLLRHLGRGGEHAHPEPNPPASG